jgi:CheY-like chemotaxis protein
MPNVDGPTALGQLRKVPELSKIPVIFMTAKVMKEEVAEFRQLGAADIIEKPFDPQSLTEQINAIWDKANG